MVELAEDCVCVWVDSPVQFLSASSSLAFVLETLLILKEMAVGIVLLPFVSLVDNSGFVHLVWL